MPYSVRRVGGPPDQRLAVEGMTMSDSTREKDIAAPSMARLEVGVPVEQLRPTQMTVGAREVEKKRDQWRSADHDKRIELLRAHTVPAVLGPKGRHFIVDHHHFAKALLDEGAETLAVYVLADLRHLPKDQFWTFLDNSAWCHAYDHNGKRQALSDIPSKLAKLADDPFRSVVGEILRRGGCAKSNAPFFEFLWADFYRHYLPDRLVEHDFEDAVKRALTLAKSPQARSLPGWAGARE